MHPALLLLADGRFPAGGHAYSAGVESAVRIGAVGDTADLQRYLEGRLAIGLTDAAFAAATVAAVGSDRDLGALDVEYDVRVMSPRLRATSRQLGRQLVRAARSVWSHPAIDTVGELPDGPHQPIALGAAVVAARGSPLDAASISIHHLATAVTTAGVRLLGLDPLLVASLQARAVDRIGRLSDLVDEWVQSSPGALPAIGGTLTEILGEAHGGWDARLFVA